MRARQLIYRWAVRDIFHIPLGKIIPAWLLPLRFALFPIQSIRWWMNDGEGYQVAKDSWYINKTHFSNDLMIDLSSNTNYWYRFKKDQHGRLTIETRKSNEAQAQAKA